MKAAGSSHNVCNLSTKLHSITSKEIIILNCYEVTKVKYTYKHEDKLVESSETCYETLVELHAQCVSLETSVNRSLYLMGLDSTPLLSCTL
jgi:hypothetical protein